MKKKKDIELYDCLVLGTGPSSEPVIYHLSKTKFSTLIVDSGDLYNKKKLEISNSKDFISGYTPKQKFLGLNNVKENKFKNIFFNFKLNTVSFLYSFSFLSGGLSNFWGGTISEWDDHEIKKTTSLNLKRIRNSYNNLKSRLNYQNRSQFSEISPLGKTLINQFGNKSIFYPSKFLLNHKLKLDKVLPFNQNLIWNSRDTIKRYIQNKKFIEYKKNTKAISIEKSKDHYLVTLNANEKSFKVMAKSIFLCAGVINSTYLAYTVLNKDRIKIRLKHNEVFVTPIISLNKFGKKNRDFFKYRNLEFSELTWSHKSKDIENSMSGFYLNSAFILNKFLDNKNLSFYYYFRNLIRKLFSRIGFIIFYSSGECSKSYLYFNRSKISGVLNYQYYLTIKSFKGNLTKIIKSVRSNIELSKYLPPKIFLLLPFIRYAKNGADIHYACTMPEKKLLNSEIQTDKYGQIIGLKNIFSCDPSRLSYLSSKSHTFTSMALVDSSMPFIINKLKKNI